MLLLFYLLLFISNMNGTVIDLSSVASCKCVPCVQTMCFYLHLSIVDTKVLIFLFFFSRQTTHCNNPFKALLVSPIKKSRVTGKQSPTRSHVSATSGRSQHNDLSEGKEPSTRTPIFSKSCLPPPPFHYLVNFCFITAILSKILSFGQISILNFHVLS